MCDCYCMYALHVLILINCCALILLMSAFLLVFFYLPYLIYLSIVFFFLLLLLSESLQVLTSLLALRRRVSQQMYRAFACSHIQLGSITKWYVKRSDRVRKRELCPYLKRRRHTLRGRG